MATTNRITIELNELKDLYEEPAIDPWNPDTRFRSGIEEIVAKTRGFPVHEPVEIALRLPVDALNEGTERDVRESLGRYYDAQIEAVTDEKYAIIREGRRDFFISIFAVLGLFLFIAFLVIVFELEGPLLSALIAWTGIASWAILWHPVESFVWGRVPLRREIQLWKKLRSSRVAVLAKD
jgi:hypothetical protein